MSEQYLSTLEKAIVTPTLTEVVLFASATRTTAVANSAGTATVQAFRRAIILLNVTAMAGASGDVLDVYVDLYGPGGAWVNAVHFPQIAGNGAAAKHYAVLDTTSPGTATVVATSDAAVSTVRPALFGAQIRGRYTLVDAGAHGQSATFSLQALLD